MSCSVLIATRNRPEMLADGIKAVLATLRPGDEFLVVDSASEGDGTKRVVEGLGVRYVRAPVKGTSIARNLGVASSTHDIIVCTDDDCRPQPGWLDVIERAFDEPDVGFVVGQVIADVERGNLPFDGVRASHARRVFDTPTDPIDIGHGACMAFRREAFVGAGGQDTHLGGGTRMLAAEDHDIFFRLLVDGWKGKYEPDALVLHRDWRTHRQVIRYCWGVGLGTGAMVGKMTRVAGLKTTRPLMRRRLGHDGVGEISQGLRKMQKGAIAASTLKFAGTLTGFVFGLVYPRTGSTFTPSK